MVKVIISLARKFVVVFYESICFFYNLCTAQFIFYILVGDFAKSNKDELGRDIDFRYFDSSLL